MAEILIGCKPLVIAADRTLNYIAVKGAATTAIAMQNEQAAAEQEWRRGVEEDDYEELERYLNSATASLTPLLHGRHFKARTVEVTADGNIKISYDPPKYGAQAIASTLPGAIGKYLTNAIITSWLEATSQTEAALYAQEMAGAAAVIKQIITTPRKPGEA